MNRTLRQWLPILVLTVLTACQEGNPALTPTVAPALRQTDAQAAPPASTPLMGILGPVSVGGQPTPIQLIPVARVMATVPNTASPAPIRTATFGAVIDPGTPPPTPTYAPTSPPSATARPGPTSNFGPVVDPNYTPPALTAVPTATPGSTGELPPPATLAPPLPEGTALRADLMGIQIHGFLTDAEFSAMLDRAAELGVKWVKFQIPWELYEPAKGQFNDFYRASVLNVQRASIRGFKTMVSIAKAPDWARPAAVRGIESGPPENPQDLADFTARFVRDVKPEFIDAIEIWNEANLIREWRGRTISGPDYMAYFRPTYAAILAEQRAQPSVLKPNHRIVVITAGPAPTVTFPGETMGDREWLQGLYDAGLARLGPDIAIGVHSYGWANPPDARCCAAAPGVTGWYEHPSFYFRETLEGYREITLRNGHDVPLWVTEFGWATYDGLKRSDGTPGNPNPNVGWQTLIDQNQQADYVVRAFMLAQSAPYNTYVGPMILWNLNFAMIPGMVDNSREEAGFSILNAKGEPRPVFHLLRAAAKQ